MSRDFEQEYGERYVAETRRINAEAARIEADVEQAKAMTRKLNAEAMRLEREVAA